MNSYAIPETRRNQTATCPWRDVESGLVYAISHALLRQAARHGMDAKTILMCFQCSEINGSLLNGHLNSHRSCFDSMIELLEFRMEQFKECYSWDGLFTMAFTGSWNGSDEGEHLKTCELCRREKGWMESNGIPGTEFLQIYFWPEDGSEDES